jgi:hypothetical protein
VAYRDTGTVNVQMGYLAVWKVLEEMVTDFKKKGITVPAEIIGDLKTAKTIIKILKADPSRGENLQKIEEYLGNVESYLVSEGQRRFGQAYVDEWLGRTDQAGQKMVDEEEEEPKSILRMPRGQKWIRLTPSKELPLAKLKTLANESNLSYNVQTDGCLLVFGPDTFLKDFVKNIAAKYTLKAGKEH